MLMRGLVIYFFMQFFRRPQPTQTGPQGADGTVQLPKGAATNLFENGTLFDLSQPKQDLKAQMVPFNYLKELPLIFLKTEPFLTSANPNRTSRRRWYRSTT